MINNETYWIGLISKQLTGEISSDEQLTLDGWLAESSEHQTLSSELHALWSKTEPEAMPEVSNKEQYWKIIEREINPAPVVKLQPRRRLWTRVASVAAVMLGLVFVWKWADNQQNHPTEPAMVQVIAEEDQPDGMMLPDGSQVWLRKGSSLSYAEGFVKRDVELEGEGYFEIAHDADRPFTVKIGDARAEVLGTKFNLKQLADGEVELFVTEGRVAFSRKDAPAAAEVLTREQIAVVSPLREVPRRLTTTQLDINRLSWQTKQLVFDHVELRSVINDLERHFHVQIETTEPGILNCEMKADFENATLADVLETIEFSLNSAITRENNTYLISGQPCNTAIK